MPKRLDAADTIDTATHFLHRLQADGWGLQSINSEISYFGPSNGSKVLLPSEAVVTIKLIPVKP